MDKQTKEIELSPDEEKQLREGQALYEMTKTEGWKVLERWLKDLAYHSWVDPRTTKVQEQWIWQELNAFHAANNANQLMNSIQKAINESEYLSKVKHGEIVRNNPMRVGA